MPSLSPPAHAQVLVCGGGVAGAYTAAALAREGIQVALFEAAKFPRYHVGESLIPSIRPYLGFIGAEEKVLQHGFTRKPGAAIKFNQYTEPGYTDFVALGHDHHAWNVVRAEFDNILLEHARSCGVQVYEQTRVLSLSYSPDDPNFPVSASWSQGHGDFVGVTTFDHVIDATGRLGLISAKHLKNRHFNGSLKNIALWGYWKGTTSYGKGTSREGSPWFEALKDGSGWAWFIPLHDGSTSVGVVVNQDIFNTKVRAHSPETRSLKSRYLSNLRLAPNVLDLITEHGQLIDGSIQSASDYSYSAPSYAGHGYRIVGDAGAFIDPFFSSGVHLAMTSALSAALTVCASVRGHCSEQEACEWHNTRFSTSYTRFQVVVLSAYKQIHAQANPVLRDVDETDYNRAFSFLRPVIQGSCDVGTQLSEDELQNCLDFCVNLFNPVDCPAQQVPSELLDVTGAVLLPGELANILGRNSNARMMAEKVNARKVVHSEYSINNLELEELCGYVANLEVGALGLRRTA